MRVERKTVSKFINFLAFLFLLFCVFGCAKETKEEKAEGILEGSTTEETAINESVEETVKYPVALSEQEIHDWIEEFRGKWEWETGKRDSSSMCTDGSNSIAISIDHGDPDDFESAYNIYQYTGCCNDGIAYNIIAIDQMDEETYEVHLENYVIILPEDSGRSFQNYTLLPTDTYIVRKVNDDKTFFMRFKGLNRDTYSSFPDGEYMSGYPELYLGQDEWYEFKLYWKDGHKIE